MDKVKYYFDRISLSDNPNEIKKLFQTLIDMVDTKQDRFFLSKLEGSIVLKTAMSVYHLILSLPEISKRSDFEKFLDLDSPEELKTKISEISSFLQKTINEVEQNEFLAEDDNIQDNLYKVKEMKALVNKSAPLFKDVNSVCNLLCDKLDKNSMSLDSSVIKINKRIIKNLIELSSSNNLPEFVLVDDFTFDQLIELFYSFTDKVEKIKVTEKKETKNESTNIKFIESTNKEKIDYVKKANDLYVEFCQDWLRDLKCQIPHSTNGQYKSLLTRIEKFQTNFNFPLKKGTQEWIAKEACKQINELMNRITNISSESYTIGMYR